MYLRQVNFLHITSSIWVIRYTVISHKKWKLRVISNFIVPKPISISYQYVVWYFIIEERGNKKKERNETHFFSFWGAKWIDLIFGTLSDVSPIFGNAKVMLHLLFRRY